jgi:hypothetical protein
MGRARAGTGTPVNEGAARQREALLAHLAARNAEHVEEFYILVTEDHCIDLAAGVTPRVVQSMARALLDWTDAAHRNALRPVREPVDPPRRKGKSK